MQGRYKKKTGSVGLAETQVFFRPNCSTSRGLTVILRTLCILSSGVLERSVGVGYWSGVGSDFGVANVGHSFVPRHKRT